MDHGSKKKLAKNFGKKPSFSFQVVTCFYLKGQRCFYQNSGLLILARQRVVKSDLDGHEFIDMSIMGIGTNTLGYGHDEVDAVISNVSGNMSQIVLKK